MYEDRAILNGAQEHPTIFAARFARCRGLLRFIAHRVLGSNEEVENALQSCWLTASCNPAKFEYEGAFRSWLLRILIDEALIILREKNSRAATETPETDTITSGQAEAGLGDRKNAI
jgi:DNA-directed RNA polymerase specialized sigma24 family protein